MKMDIKILKIGLLATAAILAPVATMMIQYELREDEEHEFEGEIELANTETVTGSLLQEKAQNTSTPTNPTEALPKRQGNRRKGNKFTSLAHCLTVFPKCKSRKQNKTFNKSDLSWARTLTIGRSPSFSKR